MASVSIVGYLGSAPELKALGSSSVLNFSVADKEYIYIKNAEAEAQWYSCELWGKQAEVLNGFLKQGSKVAVSGQLVQRSYEGKNGPGRALEIKSCRVQLLDSKDSADSSSSSNTEAPF